jgi:hypothetical protein
VVWAGGDGVGSFWPGAVCWGAGGASVAGWADSLAGAL